MIKLIPRIYCLAVCSKSRFSEFLQVSYPISWKYEHWMFDSRLVRELLT